MVLKANSGYGMEMLTCIYAMTTENSNLKINQHFYFKILLYDDTLALLVKYHIVFVLIPQP